MTFEFNGTRYQIGDAELHCGDTFNVRVAGRWLPVRIEMDASNAWYLIGADIGEAYKIPLLGFCVQILFCAASGAHDVGEPGNHGGHDNVSIMVLSSYL